MKLATLLKVSICLTFLGSEAPSKADSAANGPTARIAIIGAGAAGLTAAHELLQLGYHKITVFEREHRIGGKVFSYRNGINPIELGAIWAGDDYSVVLALADKYGVEYVQEDVDFMVEDHGEIVPMWGAQFLGSRLAQVVLEMFHANWLGLRFHKDLGKIGFADLNPELVMNFSSFAAKYRIETLAALFRPFWIGCGYSDYDDTPTIYVLRFMIPILNRAIRNVVTSLSFRKFIDGTYRFPTGYMTIFERIANTLPDLRLGTSVSKVERFKEGDRWRIRITAGDHSENFDRLIVATDLHASRRFLDLTPDEESLFSMVTTHQYRLNLFRGSDDSKIRHQMVLFDQESTAIGSPRVVFGYQRREFAPLWVIGESASHEAEKRHDPVVLKAALSLLGSSNPQLVTTVDWNYFPRVTSAAMAAGFFDHLERMQGERATFYVGSALNFETVETTAAFAQDLVRRRFSVK